MSGRAEDETLLLSHARDRARHLVETLSKDRDSLQAANRADGAALCEQAAEAARRVIGQIDSELPTEVSQTTKREL